MIVLPSSNGRECPDNTPAASLAAEIRDLLVREARSTLPIRAALGLKIRALRGATPYGQWAAELERLGISRRTAERSVQFAASPLAEAIRSGRMDLAETLTVNLQKLVILGRLPAEELSAIMEMNTRMMTCRQIADRVAVTLGEKQCVGPARDYELQVGRMHWRDSDTDYGDHLEPEGYDDAVPDLDQGTESYDAEYGTDEETDADREDDDGAGDAEYDDAISYLFNICDEVPDLVPGVIAAAEVADRDTRQQLAAVVQEARVALREVAEALSSVRD